MKKVLDNFMTTTEKLVSICGETHPASWDFMSAAKTVLALGTSIKYVTRGKQKSKLTIEELDILIYSSGVLEELEELYMYDPKIKKDNQEYCKCMDKCYDAIKVIENQCYMFTSNADK